MIEKDKQITFLNFDHTLTEQKFLQKYPHRWINCSTIPHTNGFCEPVSLQEIRKKLHDNQASPLVLIGNGNYHYITYLLMERIKQPISLILFDHHDDMNDNDLGMMSCGSWVRHALEDLPNLNKVIIIGVSEANITSERIKNHQTERVLVITEEMLKRLQLRDIIQEIRLFLTNETNIYISVDIDVLYRKEAYTNWDQGSMTLVQMLIILEQMAKHFQILGMDICGEYVMNHQNTYNCSTWEHIKMNEIVNRTLIEFIHDLEQTMSPQLL